MSVVYTGYDPELDRTIAVKILNLSAFGGLSTVDRLIQEAQAMARVAHPNVVTVYDVGRHEDGLYIAMELVEGQTLKGWMNETARPWNEVLSMFMQAGKGLAAAHEAGIVHADFKPDNALVGDDGRVRVMDFGLARPVPLETEPDDEVLHASSSTWTLSDVPLSELEAMHDTSTTIPGDLEVTGVISGTPAYMSPEQHQGMPATPRSDQFAYCVALWEALYFQRPFVGKTVFAVADAIVEGRIAPTPKRSRVPSWVRSVLLRGLAVEPEHRYPSMKSLLAALVFISKIMR